MKTGIFALASLLALFLLGCGKGAPGEAPAKGSPAKDTQAEGSGEKAPEKKEPAKPPHEIKGFSIKKEGPTVDLAAEKILVFPCDVWGLGPESVDEARLKMELELACKARLGESLVSLEPLAPAFEAAGLGGTTRKLCWGAYHMVDFHGSMDLAEDSCGQGIEDVPVQISLCVDLARDKLAPEFPVRFAFGLGMHGMGNDGKGNLKLRFISCLYDLQAKRIHTIAYFNTAIPSANGEAFAADAGKTALFAAGVLFD